MRHNQIASAALASIGCGLFLTWTPSTSRAYWIDYQAIFGFGLGLGWQQPLLIAQSLLGDKEVPTGTALMSGLKLLGGAIFLSAASTTFNNRLNANLRTMVPSLDPQICHLSWCDESKEYSPSRGARRGD